VPLSSTTTATMITTTTRPSCPYPCAGSYCPHIRSDAECIACEARPALDAHYVALEAWHRANPPTDTAPLTS
jgi:hypothetical protein